MGKLKLKDLNAILLRKYHLTLVGAVRVGTLRNFHEIQASRRCRLFPPNTPAFARATFAPSLSATRVGCTRYAFGKMGETFLDPASLRKSSPRVRLRVLRLPFTMILGGFSIKNGCRNSVTFRSFHTAVVASCVSPTTLPTFSRHRKPRYEVNHPTDR